MYIIIRFVHIAVWTCGRECDIFFCKFAWKCDNSYSKLFRCSLQCLW